LKKNKNRKQKTPLSIGSHRLIYILSLIIIPMVLYFRVVNYQLTIFDDSTIINNINSVQGSPFNLHEAFTHDAFMSEYGDYLYRPLQLISFMFDAEIGGQDAWVYHLSNLILHILTVISLFFFLKKTGVREEISFLLALLFSIHPLFTNAVAWIPARGDILLCLFTLLSFITFINYFNTKKTVYFILHAFVFILTIFSKETAVLLPLLILSYHYFVQNKKTKLKEIIPFLAIWLFSFVLFFSLRQSVLKGRLSSNMFGIIPFINNLPVIPIVIGKFFFPYNLCTMPFFEITATIIGIILLIVLIGLIIKVMHGEKRIVIWGALWFFSFSVPPMFFRTFQPIGYEYFEFRAYLPIIGLLLISGLLINKLTAGISFNKILKISIPILLLYAIIAFIRMTDFADSVSFFTSAINFNSKNAIALVGRGGAYYMEGDYGKAISDYDNAIRNCPSYSVAYSSEGLYYNTFKDNYNAEHYFSLALKYDTLNQDVSLLKVDVYTDLAVAQVNLRKYDDAKAVFKKAIKLYPDKHYLYNNLGWIYYYSKQFDSAVFEYSMAIQKGSNSYESYQNRGMAEYFLNNYKAATNDFNKVIKVKPDFRDAYLYRGKTEVNTNNFEEAISDFNIALSLDSLSGETYYYRGIAYSKLKKNDNAGKDWDEARKLGYKELISDKLKDK
jgi:protein O-mannosyl-transferase